MSLSLNILENEAVEIIREAIAQSTQPALLFSGGKDSSVLLHLARKAFRFGRRYARLPLPLLWVDTGHNYPEVVQFIHDTVASVGAKLLVASVEDSIARGTVKLAHPLASRNAAQAVSLLEAIEQHGLTALLGGARRDEEKARAKERVFSFRDRFGQWDPKNQRPELWQLYQGQVASGEQVRVFPLSNWREIDIWRYIEQEHIALPQLYFAHQREVVVQNQWLLPVTALTPIPPGASSQWQEVRFRTVGDMSCTCPVPSRARTVADIITETLASTLSERGATRMDDSTSDSAMEQRKKEGYF